MTMTKTQEYLANLPQEKKSAIEAIFGSMDKFFQCLYLIAQNEHNVQISKPEHMEQRLDMIYSIQEKVEKFLDNLNLSGYDIFADIKSDYLEDYLAARSIDLVLDIDEFVGLVKIISVL